jgi:RimJ/RimL family protein N-acetyltransferase
MRLETPRLVLRELAEDDCHATNAWEGDPRVVRYQSCDTRDLAGSRAYIRTIREKSDESPTRHLFDLAAVRRSDELVIGRAGFAVHRPDHREAEIWWVFRHDVWGQGYATEAAAALVAFGFGEIGLHRFYADCDPRNVGSIRVAEKLGMQREGVLRENWFIKGEWCDSLILGLLEDEWRNR